MNQAVTPSVSKARLSLIGRLTQHPGSPVKRMLKRLKLHKLFPFLINKYFAELSFQRLWAPIFVQNKAKVIEYWKRYRCYDDIMQRVPMTDQTTVLDVGCGVSTILHFLPGKRYGIDPLADEYAKFYAYPSELNIRKGFGESIPFPDAFCDVVFSSNMLDHTTDPAKTVSEIHRVLKPDGRFVLIVEIFPSKEQRDLAHPHSLTRDDVHALLSGKFQVLFEKTSPWMLVISYVTGTNELEGEQLIAVLKKI